MGASRSGVVSMVLRSMAWPILIGGLLSIPGALYVSHLAGGLLYGINADNPWPWLAGMMTLGICAAVAAMIPARRAASINPVDALRTE